MIKSAEPSEKEPLPSRVEGARQIIKEYRKLRRKIDQGSPTVGRRWSWMTLRMPLARLTVAGSGCAIETFRSLDLETS